MRKSVTSTDVAKKAGVSRATVSYILNDVKNVSIKDETRKKVIDAANELGYHPDSMAQSLKTNRSMAIGIVSKRKVSEKRFVDVLYGIQKELAQYKYSVTLCSEEKDERGIPEYYSFYKSKKIDGVIFLSCQEEIDRENLKKTVEAVQSESIPAVFLDYHMNNENISSIDIDYFQDAFIAGKYAIEKDYKRLILLVPDIDSVQENQRIKGLQKAVSERNDISFEIVRVGIKGKTVYNNIEDALRKSNVADGNIEEALKNSNSQTVLICAWSTIAFKTLYLAHKNKIQIPKQIGIISLADSEYFSLSYPKITACDLPLYELGRKSVEILMNQINKEEYVKVNLSLPCCLISKDSC